MKSLIDIALKDMNDRWNMLMSLIKVMRSMDDYGVEIIKPKIKANKESDTMWIIDRLNNECGYNVNIDKITEDRMYYVTISKGETV